jgi:hypothetical protein
MTRARIALLGSLTVLTLAGTIAGADAQNYYETQPRQNYYYQQQPQAYVSPRLARKQAQLRERYIEKFGYTPPPRRGYYRNQPDAYYGAQPRVRQPYGYGGYGGYGQGGVGYGYGLQPRSDGMSDIGAR